MTKPDFTDFYRFLASLGLIIAGLSLVLPWLLLRETFDSTITSAELSTLTPFAQELVNTRQYTALVFLKNVSWISSVLFVVGFGVTGFGMWLWWYKTQTHLDNVNALKGKKAKEAKEKLEFRTASEVAKGAVEEMLEMRSRYMLSLQPIDTEFLQSVTGYLGTQDLLFAKLMQCFGVENVLTNVATQGAHPREYDVVILSNDSRPEDIIIEIKTPTADVLNAVLADLEWELPELVHDYVGAMRREAKILGIVVYSGDVSEDHIRARTRSYEKDSAVTKYSRIEIITPQKLQELQCSDIKQMLRIG